MRHPHLSIPTAFLAAVLGVLSCGVGRAAETVFLEFYDKDGTFKILGGFYAQADPGTVWDVLTDYEHIPRFVGSLKKSHVQEDMGPYHFRLEQEFEGGFLFILQRARVVLEVQEIWHQNIAFDDIHRKDFEVYQGYWNLQPEPEKGLKIVYSLMAKPKFSAPFAGDFMKGGVRDLLESVRREILRRQGVQDKAATPASRAATPSR